MRDPNLDAEMLTRPHTDGAQVFVGFGTPTVPRPGGDICLRLFAERPGTELWVSKGDAWLNKGIMPGRIEGMSVEQWQNALQGWAADAVTTHLTDNQPKN